ncbi:MAG: tRNA (N(6)-L-threonylcarbamoyladenosine(37)-C(2))-methylthiotransferase MtaB [Candidatus Aminicenantes bacterium 4484_214]|nr:MAG: tRNA (N(6)-L-threonylcarbamoyladenosine(37)-C(2))-methylthiotransferase MtaB [Candidatus Aminicenantes bacterium 4484_214]RLE06939.1 MAG: tRNA (N(6)-L-threonylcarbamoyladenosine(37)-C(2))-methylthiotransferase MtaB [Candidatus Aminicenantes bacterium]
MRKVALQSFGCRLNQAEVFAWGEELRRQGWLITEEVEASDVVLVNTCTLTHRADRDVRRFLRRLAKKNPSARVLVTGCLAERVPGLLAKFPNVSKVYSNKEKNKIVQDFLLQAEEKSAFPSSRAYRSRAFLKIQDGCDFRCTFCIVPLMRGPSKSISLEEILGKIDDLLAQGFKEIVLAGVHLALFGRDLSPRVDLLYLLRQIEKTYKNADFKLRLGTLDLKFMTEELIDFLTSSSLVCPHFHFSLQSGSLAILKKMGRSIRPERYQEILVRFFRLRPEAALGADILVGFPGENEKEFETTYTFLLNSPLTYFHVFSYSPRPRTVAAEWPQVSEETKKKRTKILRQLSADKNYAFRQKFLNQELEAIVIQKKKQVYEALTDNYIKLIIAKASLPLGERISAKIVEVSPGQTKAEITGVTNNNK